MLDLFLDSETERLFDELEIAILSDVEGAARRAADELRSRIRELIREARREAYADRGDIGF